MSKATTRTERSPEQQAKIDAMRSRFASKPGPDELIDAGEIDEPVPHGQFLELLAFVRAMKAERERQGLSLTELAEASGLTRAMISQLENGHNANPTLDTLYKYALALGSLVRLVPTPINGAKKR